MSSKQTQRSQRVRRLSARNSRLRKPPRRTRPLAWHNGKAKGEWAEIVFLAKASALALAVCKPFGENHPFDFVTVTPAGKMARVQVRSAWRRGPLKKGRPFTVGRGPASRRNGDGFDAMVVYIPPHDAWYVVPSSVLKKHPVAGFYPFVAHSSGRFAKYRDAWRLLTGDPADDTRSHGLTIHACADPAWIDGGSSGL